MKKNKSNLKSELIPVLFLTIVVCIAVIALTLTNSVTEEKIEQGKLDAVAEQLKELFPNLTSYEQDSPSSIYIISDASGVIGFAFTTQGTGYGGAIDLLIGVEPPNSEDLILRGISIVSQQETPGLGTRITEEAFKGQFVGISASDIALAAEGGGIDAITGATISSKAVTDAVSAAVESNRQNILDLSGGI